MAATEDELRLRDMQAAQRAALRPAARRRLRVRDARRPRERDRAARRHEDVRRLERRAAQRDASRCAAASSSSSSARPARGKSTLMRLLIKELEPDEGRILVAGRDIAELTHKQIPYYRRNLGVVFQDFKLLPNRTVLRQRRLRAAGDGQLAQGDPREGAGHPAPHGPLDEAPQLPRPALRRRAAARLDRARVRQPPAAAAGRRADRQPRPRDLDRDHAAALPDQPHRHDRPRRHPRRDDGRPHAPPRRSSSTRAASSATRSAGATPRPT